MPTLSGMVSKRPVARGASLHAGNQDDRNGSLTPHSYTGVRLKPTPFRPLAIQPQRTPGPIVFEKFSWLLRRCDRTNPQRSRPPTRGTMSDECRTARVRRTDNGDEGFNETCERSPVSKVSKWRGHDRGTRRDDHITITEPSICQILTDDNQITRFLNLQERMRGKKRNKTACSWSAGTRQIGCQDQGQRMRWSMRHTLLPPAAS